MDVFLEELSQRCEIVIWSSMDNEHVMEWIERLDKQNPCFHSVLHSADCTIKCGEMVKDLSRLNRPLENVILVTSTASHGAYQPRNVLYLQGWDGRIDDTALLDIYVFLQCAFTSLPLFSFLIRLTMEDVSLIIRFGSKS